MSNLKIQAKIEAVLAAALLVATLAIFATCQGCAMPDDVRQSAATLATDVPELLDQSRSASADTATIVSWGLAKEAVKRHAILLGERVK